MLGFIRKAWRPFASIGEKIGSVFRIGNKAEVVSDMRNVEGFENLAPSGLRFRQPKGEIMGEGGGFYGDMNSMLKSYKYPVG